MTPQLIGICGWPGSGKSTIQRILNRRFGSFDMDDGYPLRDFAIRHFGASHHEVYLEEGKNSLAYQAGEPILNVAGEHLKWRQVLGQIGNRLEGLFGEDILPKMAMAAALKDPDYPIYTFGSVRKQQGWAYKARGGMIIGVRRPGVQPTGNDFDTFDPKAVDVWIFNNFPNLAGLEREVICKIGPRLPYVRSPLNADSYGSFDVVR